jgi:prepilin-type N-terminal cleavage/methylation domain-containing protein
MNVNKRAFTLVELLSVLVVLAIILAIAIPGITGIIRNATEKAFEKDAKMVIKAIEYKSLEDSSLDITTIKKDSEEDTVSSILKLSSENYEELSIAIDEFNKPSILIVGHNKWAGLTAYGTFRNITVVSGGGQAGYYCATELGNAMPNEVLVDKTFTNEGGLQTGMMANRTGNVNAQSISRDGTTLRFRPQTGFYDGESSNSVQYDDSDFVAPNIKNGVNIFGVIGTLVCPGGNAQSSDVLNGKTFSNDDGFQTGSMTNRSGNVTAQGTSVSGTTLRFRPQQGYYSGDSSNSVEYNDTDFVAGNIKNGVNLFGVTGTYAGLDIYLPLYKTGTEYVSMEQVVPDTQGAGSVTEGASYATLSVNSSATRQIWWSTSNPIDITGYRYIIVDVAVDPGWYGGYAQINTGKNTNATIVIADEFEFEESRGFTRRIMSLDISSYTGNHYVQLKAQDRDSGSTIVTVYGLGLIK